MGYTIKEHKEKKLVPKDMVFFETLSIEPLNIAKESVKKLSESAKGKKRKLIVKMEAIHVGRTANYNYYTKEGLTAGLSSWTTPYNKPVLTHHNDYGGEPIGRILKAEFSEETKTGKPGLIFTCEITDPDAIEKVLDGRYQTVSIGATTDKVTCNICGTDRTKEWCEHWPGEEYDGQIAHFIIGTTFGKEVSYVNVPADQYAGNISVEVVESDESESKNASGSKESAHMEVFQIAEGLFQNIRYPEINLYESLSEDAKSIITGLVLGERSAQQMNIENEKDKVQAPVQEGEKPDGANNQEAPKAPETPVKEGENAPDSQNNAVQESVETLKNRINEMQGIITNLVKENQKLQNRISEMDQENKRILQENADLHAKLHRNLAEKVVDLKRQLNKPDVVGIDREEAITNHISRSKESLENTLQDLLAELKQMRPAPGSVTNPGYSGEENTEDKKTYTLSEATNILAGMFSPKRKK